MPGKAADAKKLIPLAEMTYRADAAPPWNVSTLALAHYRAGNAQQAAALLERYFRTNHPNRYGFHDIVWLNLLRGLAEAKLGHVDAARSHLTMALTTLDRTFPTGLRQAQYPGHGWGTCAAFQQETKKALGKLPPKEKANP